MLWLWCFLDSGNSDFQQGLLRRQCRLRHPVRLGERAPALRTLVGSPESGLQGRLSSGWAHLGTYPLRYYVETVIDLEHHMALQNTMTISTYNSCVIGVGHCRTECFFLVNGGIFQMTLTKWINRYTYPFLSLQEKKRLAEIERQQRIEEASVICSSCAGTAMIVWVPAFGEAYGATNCSPRQTKPAHDIMCVCKRIILQYV